VRIERLTIERYGIFADRALVFRPDATLHIVHGANEAGKTSVLSAVGDLLFGFNPRTTYDFRHDSRTLRIGGAFRHSDGRTIIARRRKGMKNTLVDAADQPLPDDLLVPLLNGLSREVFSREFGLTAEGLRQGGHELLKAGGRLAETLAASSAGMAALSQIGARLRNEADDLFTPRRSTGKPFYAAADRRDAADKMLRDAIVTREALQQLETDVREARERLDALNAEHAGSGGMLARWQRTLRVRSKLARLEAVGAELKAFSDLPTVPAQSVAEWSNALDADAASARDIAALDAAEAADFGAIAALAVDETLLSEGEAIDALRERLGAVRKAIDDLPRRRQAREAAEATLNDAARRLGLASHGELLDRLPTDQALAHARDLIEKERRAAQAAADADARHERARQEHDRFEAEEGARLVAVDPEQLRARFEALDDIPAQADRLYWETAALKTEMDSLTAATAALDPSPGALDGLRALPLPDGPTIEAHARAAEYAEGETRRLADALAAADSAIAATETELAGLSHAGAVPTRADLLEARRARDAQFDGLRAALDADHADRERRLGDVVRSSHAVDRITDRLLTDTERAARHENALQRLAANRGERERAAADLADAQAKRAEADAAWMQSWAASGLAPRGPAEMLRWRARLDGILGRLEKSEGKKAEVGALAARLDAGKTAVASFLESVGRAPDPALPPAVLFREAKTRFDELQQAWADAKARAVEKRRIARDLAEAEAARTAAHAALAGQQKIWPAAMAAIGLAGEATPAQAEAALAVWHSVAVPKASHERESRSVDTIEADLRAFDHDVFAIVERVAPSLAGEPAQEALARLSAQLAAMRNAAASRQRLREAVAQRASDRKALMVQRASSATVLDNARRSLDLVDDAALAGAVERLTLRHQLETESAALRRDLHEIGDGRDETVLRQEQEGLDLDQLPGNIEREEVRQGQLLKDIADASAFHQQKRGELDVLLKGRDAGAAAAERAEANAELLSVAERWLLRSAASKLATHAIERHRAKVQDPLIARASLLFAKATGNAFSGLGVDYGDDDQPMLVAQRADGERVQVAGLSEGTRDQLFLALRLALLERRASEPMPFIGDDLLTSFDEDRTLAALRLLAMAGQKQQVILFTHHRHVVDLARSMREQAIDFIDL
jgi:uncharacterized protein YhaN